MYYLFLQESASSSSPYQTLILVGVMILILYLFLIRPQQRRLRAQKKYIESLKTGETIVTSGGIHGTIVSLDDQKITLEVDKGVTLTLDRTSISYEAAKRKITS